MGSFITLLFIFAGAAMIPGGIGWFTETKRQRNTYRCVIMSFSSYSLAFLLMFFFPYKPQSLISMISIFLLFVGTTGAVILVWKKYQKAYSGDTISE